MEKSIFFKGNIRSFATWTHPKCVAQAVAFDNWLQALRTRCGYTKVQCKPSLF
jgi:hypothetical protein